MKKNNVMPAVATAFTFTSDKVSQNLIEKDFISMSSLKSWVTEEDIGNACAFLISNEASKISGQVIAVDGNTEKMD